MGTREAKTRNTDSGRCPEWTKARGGSGPSMSLEVVCAPSSITRAGSTGSRNGQSEGNLDQVIGIGGKRVRRRKGSEGIGGWLEEVRRQERGVVVIVVHLGKESMSERRPKKIIKNRKKKNPGTSLNAQRGVSSGMAWPSPHPGYQSIKVAPLPPIPLWDGLGSCHGCVMLAFGLWSGHSAGWITLR